MNEFDDSNEQNKIIEIINNPNVSGYIEINNIFKYNDKYYIIPEGKYTINPQPRLQSLFLVTNENYKLQINCSLLSDDAINYVKNLNFKQTGISAEAINQAYNYLIECRSYLQKEFCTNEDFAELTERFGFLPEIELIHDYTVSFTEKLICSIFNIQFDKNSSSLVDDMLSDLFGSVKIKDEKVEDVKDDLSEYLNDPEFNLNYDNTEKEEESSGTTIDEFLTKLANSHNVQNYIDVDDKSQLESVESQNFKIIRELIDVIHIVSAQDSIECEQKFNSNLNAIISIASMDDSNILNDYCKKFIEKFVNTFYNNREIKIKLLNVFTKLQHEMYYYNESDFDDEGMKKYIKIKNILFQDIKQHFDYYTMINENALLNSNTILTKQEPTYFALLFQLSHLINKTKLKNENEVFVKNQTMKHIVDDAAITIIKTIMEFEETIIALSNEYLENFRNLISTVILNEE